jgi:hypothetical protein
MAAIATPSSTSVQVARTVGYLNNFIMLIGLFGKPDYL